MRGIILVLLVLAIIPVMYSESFASHYSHIGVTLSRTCLSMISNNYTTTCPTYDELGAIFPDSTNKVISGGFEYSDGIYQRVSGMAKTNHFEYYRYHEGTTLWIDPPGDIRGKIQLITIEPSLPEYKITGVSYNVINGTIQTGHDRYVNPNCSEIIISSENWLFLVGDTMNLLNHDCDMSHSNFDHIKQKVLDKTDMDIITSYKYKLDKWIAESKDRCREKCFEY